MPLVSATIDKAQTREPNLTDARGLELFRDGHKLILSETQARNATVDLSLTAGDDQYDLPSGVMRVWQAVYVRSAAQGDAYQLGAKTLEWWEHRRDAWRQGSGQNEPSEFAVVTEDDGNTSKLTILLDQKAPTTTSGGYPVLRLRTTRYADLLVGDSLPAWIVSDEVYVAYMCWGHCMDRKDAESAAFYWSEFKRWLDTTKLAVKAASPQAQSAVLTPSWAVGQRIV